jgi:hypothetical protein
MKARSKCHILRWIWRLVLEFLKLLVVPLNVVRFSGRVLLHLCRVIVWGWMNVVGTVHTKHLNFIIDDPHPSWGMP